MKPFFHSVLDLLYLAILLPFLVVGSLVNTFWLWQDRRLEEREDQAELERQSLVNWRRK